MKRIVFLLIFALALSACSGNEAEDPDDSMNEDMNQQTEEVEREDERKEEDEPAEDEETEVEADAEAVNDPAYYIAEDASVAPLEEGTEENVVLLTIDDAPAEYTLEMAETLQRLDAGAIFFVNGHFLDTPEEEEALKQLHEMGFLIGNHTYNHPLIPDIPEEEQREEIVSLSDRVEEIIGERPKFFRAPNGMNTDYSEQVAFDEGMVLMNWTYGYDYFEPYMDADKLAEAMITGEGSEVDVDYSLLKPGANLLMHDREWTNAALERIVNGLRDNGYDIVDPTLIQTLDKAN
ncbi:polysaccharide deacetylase family protein [Oceanobacillus alkalisoli]|uniref:polysaccharide deacetylase family protein n=1 Tax=Oceanobacillus alkalisoli TaxID=2925113 RepID=UPI001F11995E|nr:polysaccharide deacetylase family protein [Oceanobacillus alkalisoli]MCF3944730.1 polysaccharide deacetylase family protein [Oceanobacillus alkalisoli]